jgi:hypothetical protein
MATWYQATINYPYENEKGVVAKVTENYLFDSVSYTDAEARVYEFLANERPDFSIAKIAKQRLNEVFEVENNAEIWFKCKVSYIVFDEKSQKDKKVPYAFLLNAHNIKEAYTTLESKLGSVQDYIITEIAATKLLEVVPYVEAEEAQ